MLDVVWQLFDFVLHVDHHLTEMLNEFGGWTYGLLFLIIFCETGLVVTPFLPGDSLLFAAGTFAGTGHLSLPMILLSLSAAAILGDTVNYAIGRRFGEAILAREGMWLIRREHITRTEQFFDRHGGKAVVLARFAPIVRTFAPFVAGAGRMRYRRFMAYNVTGGIAWVFLCTLAGYAFGNIPIVRDNFSIVVLGIVFVSVLPMGIEIIRSWIGARAKEPKPVEVAPAIEPESSDSVV